MGGVNHKSSMAESPASPLSQLPPPFVPQHIQQQKQQQQQIEQVRDSSKHFYLLNHLSIKFLLFPPPFPHVF